MVSTLHRHWKPNTDGLPDKAVDRVHVHRRKGGCLARRALVGDVFVGPAPKMGTVYQWEEDREQG